MDGSTIIQNVATAPETRQERARSNWSRYAMAALLIVLIIAFSIALPHTFATVDNFKTVLVESSVLTLVALAVSVPLIANDFDLSVASVLGFTSILTAGLPSRLGFPVGLTIALVLLVGIVIGSIHAFLIVRIGLSPVIVTLGSSTILTGLTLWYTGGKVIYANIPESLTALGQSSVLGVPLPIVYMAVAAIILWFVLSRRPWGRFLYAVGSSEQSARLAGVKTGRIRATALIVCSLLCAVAGVVLAARLGAGNPTVSNSYFLPAFAGAFLSLAAFKVGFFNPMGVVLSVYLLAFGVSGLTLMGAPFWVEPVFDGIALIVAILLAKLAMGRTQRLMR